MTEADKIVASIAFLKLNIETLETRKSDSLDFHEVCVWNLRSALLCAFEAGRTADTRKRLAKNPKNGTGYVATIEASYEDLINIWGQPSEGDNYKTQAEWVIRLPDGKIATIYNYKNSRSYSDANPEVTQVRQWHIGGHSSDVVDRLLGMMTGAAKLVHRAG
jgi:hypothetical protein